MSNNTVLWKRGNGMYTRHTVRLPERRSDESFMRTISYYARDVFNAFPEVIAIEACDGVTQAAFPVTTSRVTRSDLAATRL